MTDIVVLYRMEDGDKVSYSPNPADEIRDVAISYYDDCGNPHYDIPTVIDRLSDCSDYVLPDGYESAYNDEGITSIRRISDGCIMQLVDVYGSPAITDGRDTHILRPAVSHDYIV